MSNSRSSRFVTLRLLLHFCGAVVLALLSAITAAAVQGPSTFSIDAADSRVVIEVGKSGAFSFAGHNHEVLAPAVTGHVTVNPGDWSRSAVVLQFDASALKVTGKGDPPSDVPQVQSVMMSDKVLDVKRFPVVAFKSRRITATPGSAGAMDLVIEGELTLHGQTRPATVRATSTLQPGGLSARGAFTIKQTDFGMEPVTAAGGAVRVKDDVQVQFDLRARRDTETGR